MTVPDTSDTPTPAAVMLERTRRRARQIRRRRRAGLASTLVLVAAVAVGIPVLVSGGSSPSRQLHVAGGPPTTASRPTITPTTSSGGGSGGAPGGGSGSSTPVTTATAPPSPGPQPCATSQLTAGLTGENGTAGAVGYQLELRNTGPTACTLRGYPGVSYVTGGNGTTVGHAGDTLRVRRVNDHPRTRAGRAGAAARDGLAQLPAEHLPAHLGGRAARLPPGSTGRALHRPGRPRLRQPGGQCPAGGTAAAGPGVT